MKVFKDKGQFYKYIEDIDPLESLEEKKRKINWRERKRVCEGCSRVFTTHHPLTKYCEDCKEKNT